MMRARQIKEPKDIQQGTANHVQMIINYLEAGGPTNVNEALMLAVDLQDQLVGDSPALVVTKRFPPFNAQLIADERESAYESGLAVGRTEGAEKSRRDVLAKLSAFLGKEKS